MVLTTQQRSFIVESYFRSGKFINGRWIYSCIECINDIRRQYLEVATPHKNAIIDLIHKFRETESVKNKKYNCRSVRLSDDVVVNIRERIEQSSKKSIRRLSIETGLSVGSLHTALPIKLKLFPYHSFTLQELKPTDNAKRMNFCCWYQEQYA